MTLRAVHVTAATQRVAVLVTSAPQQQQQQPQFHRSSCNDDAIVNLAPNLFDPVTNRRRRSSMLAIITPVDVSLHVPAGRWPPTVPRTTPARLSPPDIDRRRTPFRLPGNASNNLAGGPATATAKPQVAK